MRSILLIMLLSAAGFVFAQGLQRSHIQANVPESDVFEAIMRRDLSDYFGVSEQGSDNLKYILLREGPTQSGVAYPKFYAWVIVQKSRAITTGAVRLAAIDKTRFEVTDFVPSSEIRSDPGILQSVFPSALLPTILEHARAN